MSTTFDEDKTPCEWCREKYGHGISCPTLRIDHLEREVKGLRDNLYNAEERRDEWQRLVEQRDESLVAAHHLRADIVALEVDKATKAMARDLEASEKACGELAAQLEAVRVALAAATRIVEEADEV